MRVALALIRRLLVKWLYRLAASLDDGVLPGERAVADDFLAFYSEWTPSHVPRMTSSGNNVTVTDWKWSP